MIRISFNGRPEQANSLEEFGAALRRYSAVREFELWLNAENGASMSLLRNGDHAFLMYLGQEGDSGFVTSGDEDGSPVRYRLSNGQVDEYPRCWCIPLEKAYEAVAEFYGSEGSRPDCVEWQQ